MSGINCFECREKLVEMARGSSEAAAALHHVDGCEECERAWLNQRTLSAGLRAIAANETAMPSAMLEAELLTRFAPVRRRVFPRWAIPALAGAAAMVALLWIYRTPTPQPLKVLSVIAAKTPAAPARVTAVTAPIRNSTPRRLRPVRHIEARPDAENPFIPIPYAAPLLATERAEIVRVNLSASALARLGMPVEGADPKMRLNADLLLGENGLAHAVRIIQ